MAIAKLEFDLENPDDRDEFKRAQKAYDLIRVISEFNDQSLRKRIKYQCDDYTQKEIDLLEKIREELWEKVKEYECMEIVD